MLHTKTFTTCISLSKMCAREIRRSRRKIILKNLLVSLSLQTSSQSNSLMVCMMVMPLISVEKMTV